MVDIVVIGFFSVNYERFLFFSVFSCFFYLIIFLYYIYKKNVLLIDEIWVIIVFYEYFSVILY